MKKYCKRFISVVLCIVMLFGTAAVDNYGLSETVRMTASAENATSGTCGDHLTWVLDDSGTLTISGMGDMYDYAYYSNDYRPAPWYSNIESIKTVIIESGVTSIGSNALVVGVFSKNEWLTSVSIGKDVVRIAQYAFDNCKQLSSLSFAQSSKLKIIEYGAFYGCESLCHFQLPHGIESIGVYAFAGTGYVHSYEDFEFSYETNLHNMVYYGGVYNGEYLIEFDVWHWLPERKSYSIKAGTVTIAAGLSIGKAVEEIIVPNSVKYISDSDAVNPTFGGSKLKTINIPSGAAKIGNGCFAGSSNLNTISIPNNITDIGDYAFYRCTGLSSITIPNSVTSIGPHVFEDCTSLASVTIPNSITSIGERTFSNCTGLASITIPDSVTSIGYSAFYSCTGLLSITIPNSVTSIGSSAFYDCAGLTSITIPNSVTSIDTGAFSNCTRLASITIPDSVTSIGRGGSLFKGCISLKTAGPIGGGYSCEFGWTKSIPSSAFSDCTFFQSITIPDSVTDIGDSAFYGCTGLTAIKLPSELKNIHSYTFGNCAGLTSIIIPDSVYSIGSYAFDGCTNLSQVMIPVSVGRIYSSAFRDCTKLTDLYYAGTESEWGKIYIASNNEPLSSANKHYNSTGSGNGTELDDTKIIGTINDKGLAQKRFISMSENKKQAKSVLFSPAGGSDNDSLFCVPGLDESYIPQGLTYYKENNWILVSSYYKTENNKEKKSSVIIALDADTGEFVAQFNLINKNGNPSTPHAGGIAVSSNNLYITYDHGVAYVPLWKLSVESKGYVKTLLIQDDLDFGGLGDTYNAYLDFSDNILFAGNFYSPLGEKSWMIKAPGSNSVMLGFKLKGDNSIEEWNYLKAIKNTATYTIMFPKNIKCIQGATFYKNVLYLSRTTAASFGCVVSYCNLQLNSKTSKVKLKDSQFSEINNLCGAENIVIINDEGTDYLWSVYESKALNLYGDFWWDDGVSWYDGALSPFFKAGNFKTQADCLWKMPLDALFSGASVNIFNCPINIDVYDDDNNLVCRIFDNEVDLDVFYSENGIPAEVDEDTKYIYTPKDKNYRFVITGYDDGKMDYSVVSLDKNLNESQRVNFFDIDIHDGESLTGELKTGMSDFSLENYTIIRDDSTSIMPSVIMNNESIKYSINISTEGNGSATESMTAVSGDYVSLDAAESDDSAFMGWYENGKLIEKDTSLSFVAKKNRDLVAKFQGLLSAVLLNCKSPTTVDYRSKVTVVASASYVPNGYFVALYDGDTQLAKGDSKTVRYKVGEMRANKALTARIVDASGIVQKDSSGNALAANIEIKVNAGFFKKLAAFFKGIFGFLPNVEINPNVEAKEKTCVLTYDANKGSSAPANQNGYGKVTIPDSVPKRDGYCFLGWALNEKAVDASYQPGDTILLVENRTLYAVWQKIEYALIYDANDGEDAPSAQIGNGTVMLSSAQPKRAGYTFLGWALSTDATTAAYQPGASFSLTGNTTLYAVWKKDSVRYTVTISKGYGISSVQGAGSYVPGDVVTVSCTVMAGYTFSKWAVTSPTPLGDAKQQSFSFTMPQGNVSLIADAVDNLPVQYSLNFDSNGGSFFPFSIYASGVITLLSSIPEREGHVFLGWATSADASSAEYSPNDYFVLSKNTTLYAVWVVKGDVNMDGDISLVDLVRLRYFLEGSAEFTAIQKSIADLNNDGTVNDADLTLMRQIIVGMSA